MLNLSVLLEDSAREAPQHTAVIFNEIRLSYAQVNAAANQVAHGLRNPGVEPGDKGEVVIRGHNVMKGYYNKPEANEEALRSGWSTRAILAAWTKMATYISSIASRT